MSIAYTAHTYSASVFGDTYQDILEAADRRAVAFFADSGIEYVRTEVSVNDNPNYSTEEFPRASSYPHGVNRTALLTATVTYEGATERPRASWEPERPRLHPRAANT
jgi:hypothetical protein